MRDLCLSRRLYLSVAPSLFFFSDLVSTAVGNGFFFFFTVSVSEHFAFLLYFFNTKSSVQYCPAERGQASTVRV